MFVLERKYRELFFLRGIVYYVFQRVRVFYMRDKRECRLYVEVVQV